jgi:hypothetical protein
MLEVDSPAAAGWRPMALSLAEYVLRNRRSPPRPRRAEAKELRRLFEEIAGEWEALNATMEELKRSFEPEESELVLEGSGLERLAGHFEILPAAAPPTMLVAKRSRSR